MWDNECRVLAKESVAEMFSSLDSPEASKSLSTLEKDILAQGMVHETLRKLLGLANVHKIPHSSSDADEELNSDEKQNNFLFNTISSVVELLPCASARMNRKLATFLWELFHICQKATVCVPSQNPPLTWTN